jgi:ATP-dependent helicase/nuclease subunit B
VDEGGWLRPHQAPRPRRSDAGRHRRSPGAAIDYTAGKVAENRAAGRLPIVAEVSGEAQVAGITLHGKVDRIDRCPDNSLAIVDYKTGQPPSKAAVAEGFALQLGLLGLIAQAGGFEGAKGRASAFEYWSLARDQRTGALGYVADAAGISRNGVGVEAEDFTAHAARNLAEAAGKWLLGEEPFTAKLHPEYAPYGDYDQLMRLDEWYGRDNG